MANLNYKSDIRTRTRIQPNLSMSNAMHAMHIEHATVDSLKPFEGNPRRHSEKQITQLAAAVRQFRYINPIVITGDGTIIAGHARYEAAQQLGLPQVPVIRIEHLTDDEVRAYRIADNRLAELSEWDEQSLKVEIEHLVRVELAGELSFDLPVLGFETPEIDMILDVSVGENDKDPDDDFSGVEEEVPPITRVGEIWNLGRHKLACGSALDPQVYERLMGGTSADLAFSDPPYNVPISGHVRGKGKHIHREFAMGVGEFSQAEFTKFLSEFLSATAQNCRDGAVLMVCMDWRHLYELQMAAESQSLSQLNMCVWAKTNGGQGSFYRSQHELVLIYKKGEAAHLNNVQLGKFGRYRTNVWTYAGVNTFRKGRDEELNIHPTVKPVALVVDAIKDVTHHGDVVLDPFGGSGTTLIAAERAGRIARLIELEPRYVDVTIRRWEKLTGEHATMEGTGQRFSELEASPGVGGCGNE